MRPDTSRRRGEASLSACVLPKGGRPTMLAGEVGPVTLSNLLHSSMGPSRVVPTRAWRRLVRWRLPNRELSPLPLDNIPIGYYSYSTHDPPGSSSRSAAEAGDRVTGRPPTPGTG